MMNLHILKIVFISGLLFILCLDKSLYVVVSSKDYAEADHPAITVWLAKIRNYRRDV